jgi:hypothetical protein
MTKKKFNPPSPNAEQLAGIKEYHENQEKIRQILFDKWEKERNDKLHPKERKKVMRKIDKVILERLNNI